MNNFFSPDLFDDMHTRGISCCGMPDKILTECQWGGFDN